MKILHVMVYSRTAKKKFDDSVSDEEIMAKLNEDMRKFPELSYDGQRLMDGTLIEKVEG